MFKKIEYINFPKLGDIIDTYIKAICNVYETSSNKNNLLQVTDFLENLPKLSKEDFSKNLERFPCAEQEFMTLYFLIQGKQKAVEVVLYNNGKEVKPEYMTEYVKYVQNSAIKRVNEAIQKLSEAAEKKLVH